MVTYNLIWGHQFVVERNYQDNWKKIYIKKYADSICKSEISFIKLSKF